MVNYLNTKNTNHPNYPCEHHMQGLEPAEAIKWQKRSRAFVSVYVCMCVYIYITYIYIYHTYIYIYITHIYIYIYIIYIYIYISPNKHPACIYMYAHIMMVVWVMPASYFCVYFHLIPHFTHLFKIPPILRSSHSRFRECPRWIQNIS